MTNRYILLFNLDVTHSYYENDICRDLVYTPSKNTQKLINRFSFKIEKRMKGFSFYTEEKESYAAFLNYIEQATELSSFDFDVSTINSNFYQVTSVFPINEIGYFSYESNHKTQDTSTIILKETFNPSSNATAVFKLKINFSDIIALKDTENPISFKIQLEARSTQWVYNIINTSNQDFGTLSIKSSSKIVFDSSKKVTLQNGQEALQFSSGDQKIPLKQVPKFTFDLANTTTKLGNNRTNIIFKGLPNANPAIMDIYKDNGKDEVMSLMYVYI